MPNWCSNRMYFSGEPAQIAEIKRLASGAVTPLYRRATNEGIQLFLAGSAGLLQTTEDVRFEPCPGLTAAGRGVVSTENIAFTRWLTHLQNGVLLDEQNCLMLHELWLQSGTGQRRWEGLPDDVRDTITALFTAKRGDWCGFWSNEDVSVWWNRLCDNVLPEKTMPFDLLTVLPTRLDVEVNGFNGGVLNGVPSAYHWYTERYGVKWPCGYDLNISSQGDNFIQVDFDTPWCQPESDVNGELLWLESRRSLYVCLEKCGIQRCWSPGLHQKLHIEGRICGLSPRMCLHPGKRPSTSATKPAAGRAGLEIFGQSSSPDGKARYQPATAD